MWGQALGYSGHHRKGTVNANTKPLHFAVLVVLYCSFFERNHDDALFSRRFTSEPGDKSIDYSVAYKYNRLFVLTPLHAIHSRSILIFLL